MRTHRASKLNWKDPIKLFQTNTSAESCKIDMHNEKFYTKATIILKF